VNRYWRQLLPAYLFTWPVFIVTYAWAILVHFADSINNSSGELARRFIVITVLHTIVFVILYGVKELILDRVRPTYVPSLLFLSFACVAILRGFLMEYWLYTWDVIPILDLTLRMMTSLFNITSTFSFATITTANTRRHIMTKSHLLNEVARLENLKADALVGIKSVDSDAVRSIKTELFYYVNSMQGRTIPEVLTILRTMIDKVVQPLSRRLETEFFPWTPPEIQVKTVKVDWYRAFITSLNPQKIHYFLVPFLMIAVSIPTVLSRTPLSIAVIGLSLTYLTALLVGKGLQSVLRKRSSSIGTYILATLITGFLMGVSNLLMTRNYESPNGFLVLATIFYPFTSALVSMLTGAEEQLVQSTKELAETTAELEWNVARIREFQHRSQRALARTLHGEIQAKLSSTYLELERLSHNPASSQEKLQEFVDVIRESIGSIQVDTKSPDDLMEVIEKVRRNWANVAEIRCAINGVDLEKIKQDPLCTVALVDVIPELVFNGIKHGNATQIDVSLQFISDRVLRLTVKDNGVRGLVELRVGLGTRVLNESSISWMRERREPMTITTAEFAFSTSQP